MSSGRFSFNDLRYIGVELFINTSEIDIEPNVHQSLVRIACVCVCASESRPCPRARDSLHSSYYSSPYSTAATREFREACRGFPSRADRPEDRSYAGSQCVWVCMQRAAGVVPTVIPRGGGDRVVRACRGTRRCRG